jgi:hypothetical protein
MHVIVPLIISLFFSQNSYVARLFTTFTYLWSVKTSSGKIPTSDGSVVLFAGPSTIKKKG